MVLGPAPSGLKTRIETRYCVNTDRSSRVWLWWKLQFLKWYRRKCSFLRWPWLWAKYDISFVSDGLVGHLCSRVFDSNLLGVLGTCVPRPERKGWQSKHFIFEESDLRLVLLTYSWWGIPRTPREAIPRQAESTLGRSRWRRCCALPSLLACRLALGDSSLLSWAHYIF